MVKKLKNLFLRNQKTEDLETWYSASGARVLQVCSNDDPGLTLTYFRTWSSLVPYALVWEEGKTMAISETIVVYIQPPPYGPAGQNNPGYKLGPAGTYNPPAGSYNPRPIRYQGPPTGAYQQPQQTTVTVH